MIRIRESRDIESLLYHHRARRCCAPPPGRFAPNQLILVYPLRGKNTQGFRGRMSTFLKKPNNTSRNDFLTVVWRQNWHVSVVDSTIIPFFPSKHEYFIWTCQMRHRFQHRRTNSGSFFWHQLKCFLGTLGGDPTGVSYTTSISLFAIDSSNALSFVVRFEYIDSVYSSSRSPSFSKIIRLFSPNPWSLRTTASTSSPQIQSFLYQTSCVLTCGCLADCTNCSLDRTKLPTRSCDRSARSPTRS